MKRKASRVKENEPVRDCSQSELVVCQCSEILAVQISAWATTPTREAS